MDIIYDVVCHNNQWYWGESVDVICNNGAGMICVKFDNKSFPNTAYICDLSVVETKRRNRLGTALLTYALNLARSKGMTFARLHVDSKNIWLREWYQRLGFKELSRDENEIEMIKEL